MERPMKRLQIYIKPEQDRALQKAARRLKTSKAELIREGIDLVLSHRVPVEEDPLMKLIGLAGETGYPDLSANHDHYLYIMEKESREKGHRDDES